MLHAITFILAVLATVASAAIFVRGFLRILAVVRSGRPTGSDRARPVGARTWVTVKEIFGHGRFKHKPVVRAAHWFVMLSFPLLFLTLVAGYGQILNPGFVLPVIGSFPPYEWVVEAIAWACLVAIVALIAVRIKNFPTADNDDGDPGVAASPADPQRPRTSRFFGSAHWQAFYVEAVVLGVAACVIALRALEYAYLPGTALHFPLTGWLGALFAGASHAALGAAIVVVALIKILISLSWFVVVGLQPTMGVAWHRFLAVANVYARREPDGEPALGPLPPMVAGGVAVTADALEELDEDATLGVGTIDDFSWKGLLDFSTCTECGRCQDICPAWQTGKPLTPKGLITTLRDHADATLPLAAARGAETSHAGVDVFSAAMQLVPDVIDPDVIWSCTSCGGCVDQCPVDIEHVDHITDMRRHQVLMESAFPKEFAKMFRALETKGNPWGQAPRKRMEWAKDLPFDIPQAGVDIESLDEVEYLMWIGCAGAYENRAKKTVQALAELLHTAGVSFAVLGDGESCTGDPARRAGNEILFQMLASQNVETLNELGATKIVVSCAHCFNTIAREYPQLGGNYEVVHHTQLLNRLVRDGNLRLAPPTDGQKVTYHDPCFLGRHNKIYAPPRELLGAVTTDLVEMPRNQEMAMCCGGGGARVWTEEKIGERINQVRAKEAATTGANVVATGCPFCIQMISDGSAANGDDVEVRDVATLMLDSVRRASER